MFSRNAVILMSKSVPRQPYTVIFITILNYKLPVRITHYVRLIIVVTVRHCILKLIENKYFCQCELTKAILSSCSQCFLCACSLCKEAERLAQGDA